MKSSKRTLIFLICYIAYTSIYIARLNLTMASTTLQDTGVLTVSQYGMLGTVFAVIYACGRLFNGALSDKAPPYLMISVGLFLAGVSNVAIGFLPPFVGILLLWGCNSFAQSMLWSSVLCAVSAVYEPAVAKRKTSLMVSAVATGNILGILAGSLLINFAGVRWAFVIPGALTIVMGGAVLAVLRKIPAAETKRAHQPMFRLFRQSEIRLTVTSSLFHGLIKDNVSYWMPLFLLACYGVNLKESTWYVLLIPVIGFLGRLAYPVCFRLAKERENTLSVILFAACALLTVPLLFGAAIPMAVAAVALGMIYALTSMINTSLLSIYPLRFTESGNVASVSGLMDFAAYMGYGIGSAVFGFLIEALGDGVGYPVMYGSWIALAVGAGLLLLPLLREKKQK